MQGACYVLVYPKKIEGQRSYIVSLNRLGKGGGDVEGNPETVALTKGRAEPTSISISTTKASNVSASNFGLVRLVSLTGGS